MRTIPVATSILILAAFPAGAQSAPKRPFAIADHYRTAMVGTPHASSGGGPVAFDVTRYDLEAGQSWSEVWVLDPATGATRQMTFGRRHDTTPVVSPDGRRIAFVSDRSGEMQVWTIAVDGGEARRLSGFPGGVSAPVWSPDGRFLAVTADVYPECGGDAECNRTIREDVEGGPLAVVVADRLLHRHWTEWRHGRFRHVLLLDGGTGEVVRDLTPGPWDSPPLGASGGRGYDFAPDGRSLVFVSKRDREPALSTDADLWLVDLEQEVPGPPRRLTDGPGWDGDPTFSPDGLRIAYRSQARAGAEADLYRLAVLHVPSGEVELLTDRERFDDWVTSAAWAPGGRSLVFGAERRGRQPLHRVDLVSGEIRELLVDGAVKGWTVAGGEAVVSLSRVGSPPELYGVGLESGGARRLTRFNADLEAEVDIRSAEEMTVRTEDGREIQVFVVTPHGFDPDRRYPLILNVHGGPQSPWRDRYRGDWQVYPGAGYVVAFANPTGSAGFGQDLVDAISCDWGGRVFDDLMRVTDALAELRWVDEDRMGAMGWSYGGYMMMWFEGHTDRFRALASMMGVYDLRSFASSTEELWFPFHETCGPPWEIDDRWSPSTYVESFRTPCLVITGERDYRVPYTQSLQFFTDLQLREVPSRLVVFPEAGHWPSWYEMAFYYTVHLDWFARYLGGDPPPWDPTAFARNQVFGGGGDAPE